LIQFSRKFSNYLLFGLCLGGHLGLLVQVQSSKNKIINKQYCYIDLQTSFFGMYFDIISIDVVQCQMSNVLAISMQEQVIFNEIMTMSALY
jgi:hypothetical protein